MVEKVVGASGINIFWENKIGSKRYLKFSFRGELIVRDAEEAVTQWKKEFNSQLKERERTSIIWNCLKMTGYESDARKLWQKSLSDLTNQIDDIWIVTDNAIFKMVAKTMALLTRYNLKIVSSEEEIEWKGSI